MGGVAAGAAGGLAGRAVTPDPAWRGARMPAPRAGPDTFIKMHIYAYEHILFEPGRRLFKPGRRPRMAAEAAHGGRSSA